MSTSTAVTPLAAAGLAARALRHAALAARQAPSVHNTQPWAFALGATSLAVHTDWNRQVGGLDPRGRQLLLSGGCAVFNARVALAAAGTGVTVERLCDADRPRVVARLSVDATTAPDAELASLEPFLTLRHTNRRPFVPGGVDRATAGRLVAAAAAEGAELWEVVTDADRLALVRAGGRVDRSDEARWRDLGVPAPETSPLQPTTFLLGTRADTPAAWERTGEALQRVWLELTRAGHVAAPVTQVVEDPSTRARLRHDLRLAGHPHILLRVGRAEPSPATRRRLLSDLLVPGR